MFPFGKRDATIFTFLAWLILLAEATSIAKPPEAFSFEGKEVETRSLISKRRVFDKTCTAEQLEHLSLLARQLALPGYKLIWQKPATTTKNFNFETTNDAWKTASFLRDVIYILGPNDEKSLIRCERLYDNDCKDGHPTAVHTWKDTVILCPEFWGPEHNGYTDLEQFQSVALLRAAIQLQI
ncbi:uncharacterized protein PgNI_12015, partial [Pyricularia grisea]|uniref:Uncharacterized protein n=1 Tax=Pyricularia grisea TaxID=148305 RepID=A0A6P8AQM7_PYRGI